jgi:hypothetical protein
MKPVTVAAMYPASQSGKDWREAATCQWAGLALTKMARALMSPKNR